MNGSDGLISSVQGPTLPAHASLPTATAAGGWLQRVSSSGQQPASAQAAGQQPTSAQAAGCLPPPSTCGPFVVGPRRVYLQPAASPAEDSLRREHLMNTLLAQAPDYGAALFEQCNDKMACFARLDKADLASFLTDPSPGLLLDSLWSAYQQQVQQDHAADGQQLDQPRPLQKQQQHQLQQTPEQHQQENIVYHPSVWQQQEQQLIAEDDVYYPAPPQQEQEPLQEGVAWLQQQDQHDSNHFQQDPGLAQPVQQQQSDAAAAIRVSGPRDLSPAAAAAFESALPMGLLPDNWQNLLKWGAFEMECKFTVAGSDRAAIQDLRTRFKQAKEAAIAATQMGRQQQQQAMCSTADHQAGHVSSRSNGLAPPVQSPSVSLSAVAAPPAAAYATQPEPEAHASHGDRPIGSGRGRGRSRSNVRAPPFSAANVKLHASSGNSAGRPNSLDTGRRERLINALRSKAPEYAAALPQQGEKFAELSRIVSADLDVILQQQRPGQALEDVYMHLLKTRGLGQLQQYHPCASAVKPCDVPSQLRRQFEDSLPPGALPEFWMTFQSWQQLESKVDINAFGPSSRPGFRGEEVKSTFSRAVSEIIEAVVEALRLQCLPGQQRQGHQRQGQQQREPGPCDLPHDLADHFAAALPDRCLPRDWQQCESWSALFAKVRRRARNVGRVRWRDIEQLYWDGKEAVVLEYAGRTGDQQQNGQQQCAEDHKGPADTSAEPDGSGFDGQQEGPGQQEQQSGQGNNSVRPCDLPPMFASQLAAAADGRLPDDWQHCDSWLSLEALVDFGRNPLEARRQFRAAKMAACDAYKEWLQLQQQPPAALDSNSSSDTVRHQQGATGKRTVAPCDLPAAATSLLESLVPAGVLPANWQAYPTWSDLDVAVCHTAGGTDPSAVNDSIRRFKEAKQAALTAAADGSTYSANGVPRLQQQQQQAASRPDTSSVATGPNSSRNAAGAAAPARPSVSWAQAAAGKSQQQDAAGTGPAATAQPRTPLGKGHTLAGTSAVPAQQPISRSSSGDASSTTNTSKRSNTINSSTEPFSNSRLGSSSASAAPGPPSSCRDAPAATAARAPANGKYVPAYDPVCSRCGARGHAVEQCSTPYCPSCTQWGHADGIDCLSACHHCGRIHHGAGYVRCEEKSCDNCQLTGHMRFECPHIMCGYCKCYGHMPRDCRACTECGEWGHSVEQCQGFCRKCNEPGHRTADCRVKRCGQCGKAGCVVGMCSEFAAHNSRGSRVGRGRGSSRSATGTTAVVATGLFNLSEVTFDVADSAEQEQEREELLVSKLMEVSQLDEYACALLTEDAAEKLAVLATISAADLSLILQQQNPAGLLDQIFSMQAAAAARKPALAVADPSGIDQSSQPHSGVMQQQGGTAIMPCDLGPKHTQMLEDRLPAGSLPADWFEYDTWIELEREFIAYIKTTHVRGTGAPLQERRIAFRRARQYVQAVAAGTIPEQQLQQWSDSPRRQEKTEYEQQDRLNPSAKEDRDRPPATPQRWWQQQQQEAAGRDGWPVIVQEQHEPPASSDGWPVVERKQHAEPEFGDGWAADEQPTQPVAPRETAWARKLDLGQPETKQQQQQTADDQQQQQQIGDQSDQVYRSAEPLQKEDPAEAALAHAVSSDDAVPAAQQPPGDSLSGQPEHQQRSVALPAYTAAVAGAAVMPMISQLAPVHPLHFPHHQMQQHPLQMGVPSQQQQQQQQPGPAAAAKVLGPRDLTPAAAAAFEASLPPGLLPEKWRSLPKWGAFEMECKFTVAGSDPKAIQDLRTQFKQARETAKAHTQAERAGIAQPLWQQQQQQAPLQIPQHGQIVEGPPPGFAPTMPPPSTAALVAPSPIYVLGHQALQQQQQHAEPVLGIPVGSMGIPAGSMYPPSYTPPVATSAAGLHVPAHPYQLMLHPAVMPQHAAMQHYGAPGQHMPAAAAGPAAASHAAAMAMPHGVSVGHPGTHLTAVGHGPPGPSAATTAAAGGGSDEDLDDILNLCGAQDT